MTEDYLERVKFLLSMNHPVRIQDVATLTFSSETEVLSALSQLSKMGFNVWMNGEFAEIRGVN